MDRNPKVGSTLITHSSQIEIAAVPDTPYFVPANPASPGTPLAADEAFSSPTKRVPTLFTPMRIRGKTLRNRIIVAPMCQFSSSPFGPNIGKLTDYHTVLLGGFALRGAGLVFTEATGVTANGRITPNCPGLWDDNQIEPLRRVADFVKSQGALMGVQLGHAGRKGSTCAASITMALNRSSVRADKDQGGWPDQVVGPMGGPTATWDEKGLSPDGGFWPPSALSEAQIHDIVQAFADAAARAIQAGVDVIEIHAAHGYLIAEFLSPVTNARTDRYGGSFEHRIRFLVEIIAAIRKAIPRDTPFFVRISSTEWMDGTEAARKSGSWEVDSTIQLAKLLPNLGVDVLDVSSGGNHWQQRVHMFSSKDYQIKIAGAIRQAVRQAGVPLLIAAVGRITQAEQARDIVETEVTGQDPMADVILVGRQFLREPEWVLKIAPQLGVDIAWPIQFSRPDLKFTKL